MLGLRWVERKARRHVCGRPRPARRYPQRSSVASELGGWSGFVICLPHTRYFSGKNCALGGPLVPIWGSGLRQVTAISETSIATIQGFQPLIVRWLPGSHFGTAWVGRLRNSVLPG